MLITVINVWFSLYFSCIFAFIFSRSRVQDSIRVVLLNNRSTHVGRELLERSSSSVVVLQLQRVLTLRE